MTIRVLAEKGQNHCEIARTVGVTEGTVRYHLRRAAEEAEDGRKEKPFKAECVAEVIAAWHAERRDRPEEEPRPVNVQELYEHLVAEHGYEGSYDSVLRYVRSRYPKPRIRTYRRVETPPGAQAQSDWGEFPGVAVGHDVTDLSAFLMTLSHSRKPAVVWSPDKGLLSWLGCHNGAFHHLAGVAAVNRIDNVKTALASGAGVRGVVHPAYHAYARSVGFHVDACEPGHKEAKGKVEAKVRLSRLRLDPYHRRWDSLEELQAWTDERIERWAERATCPATGRSVAASWEAELAKLAPLPMLPEPFDVAVARPVHKDCMVRFEQVWLGHAAERLGELLEAAVKSDQPAHRFLDHLLAAETSERELRRIKTSLRLSGLPPGQTLGNFDFAFQPSVEKSRIETLATCAWIREHATTLIQGPPGVGKTHLAVALGVKAVENGFSVAFYRFDDLLHLMKQDAETPPQRLRRKKYNNVALLIVDEVGFPPLSRPEASLFFRLVSYRYQRGSTLITTNKAVKDWPEILAGDEAMAAALLDRLLHHCHVLNIRAPSPRGP